LIEGIVCGFDVACRIAEASEPAVTNARGFHPTGTVGAIGAAVASGKLLNLTSEQFVYAIGIACSQASGLLAYLDDGAWTKRFHAGWAAHSGLISASLAKRNFTGPKTAIESKFGFLHAYSGDYLLDAITEGLGKEYKILDTAIKYYPCNYYIQSVNDATLNLVKKHHIDINNIKAITIYTVKAAYNIVCTPIEIKRNPQSMIDAQFSIPFNVAVALAHKQVDFLLLTPTVWTSPIIKHLMDLVECIVDNQLTALYPAAWPARVEIYLKDSEKPLVDEVKHPKGSRLNPLSWYELITKHKSIIHDLVKDKVDDQLIEMIQHLETLPNFNTFSELLRKAI
jgi:2-methylcitrate dehydratase PrpD